MCLYALCGSCVPYTEHTESLTSRGSLGYVCVHKYIHLHTYSYKYMRVCVCVVHIYIHIDTYTYIYRYMHVCIYVCMEQSILHS